MKIRKPKRRGRGRKRRGASGTVAAIAFSGEEDVNKNRALFFAEREAREAALNGDHRTVSSVENRIWELKRSR